MALGLPKSGDQGNVIGLIATLQDKDFQKGLKIYLRGVSEIAKDTKKSSDSVEKSNKKSSKSFTELASKVELVKRAFRAVVQLVRTGFVFGKLGASIDVSTQSFNRFIETLGLAPDLLNQMRDAAAGTISDLDLMQKFTLGLSGASNELARALGEAAPQLIAMSRAASALDPTKTVTFFFDSLVKGIRRSSPRILDNLGLIIKLGEANTTYAATLGKTVEELSATERQQALLNEVLRNGEILLGQVGDGAILATDPYNQLTAAFENLKNTLAQELNPAISQLVSGWVDAATGANDLIIVLRELRKEAIGGRLGWDDYVNSLGAAGPALEVWNKSSGGAIRRTFELEQVTADLEQATGRVTDEYDTYLLSIVAAKVANEELTAAESKQLIQFISVIGLASEAATALGGMSRSTFEAAEAAEAQDATLIRNALTMRDSISLARENTIANFGLSDSTFKAAQEAEIYDDVLLKVALDLELVRTASNRASRAIEDTGEEAEEAGSSFFEFLAAIEALEKGLRGLGASATGAEVGALVLAQRMDGLSESGKRAAASATEQAVFSLLVAEAYDQELISLDKLLFLQAKGTLSSRDVAEALGQEADAVSFLSDELLSLPEIISIVLNVDEARDNLFEIEAAARNLAAAGAEGGAALARAIDEPLQGLSTSVGTQFELLGNLVGADLARIIDSSLEDASGSIEAFTAGALAELIAGLESASTAARAIASAIRGIPDVKFVKIIITTTGREAIALAGGGVLQAPRTKGSPTLPLQAGGIFTVPQQFQRDSFPLNLDAGELVAVLNRGQQQALGINNNNIIPRLTSGAPGRSSGGGGRGGNSITNVFETTISDQSEGDAFESRVRRVMEEFTLTD